MKLINSTVALCDPTRLNHKGSPFFSQAKTITRKRERAGLREMVAKEILIAQAELVFERQEKARMVREQIYTDMMARINRVGRKSPRRPKPATDTYGSPSCERSVLYATHTGVNGNERLVLASCAVD